MIRINMFSQADSVQGQGVGSAYKELVRLLRSRLVEDFYVTINKYGASDLTHYHTINPTYFVNSFSILIFHIVIFIITSRSIDARSIIS